MKRVLSILFCFVCGIASATGIETWRNVAIEGRPALPKKETRSPMTLANAKANVSLFGATSDFSEADAIMRKYLPLDINDDANWKTIFSAEEESIAECVIDSENNTKNYFSVYTRMGFASPFYWVGENYPIVKDVTYSNVYDFVKATFSTAGRNVKIAGFSTPLNASEIKIKQLENEEHLPYERFWFMFIDDNPNARWGHPCRYVYLSEDLSSFTVTYRMWFPQIISLETGECLGFDNVEGAVEEIETIDAIRQSITRNLGTSSSRAISYAGDVSKSHFVLIHGGMSPEANTIDFWADTAMFYSTLTLKYKVPKSQIHVYMSDGNNSGKDARIPGNPDFLISSPLDLDGDGIGDVDGAATRSNIEGVFSKLQRELDSDEQLVVFMTSHGGADGWEWRFQLFGEAIYDHDIHDWTKAFQCPIAFMVAACFSGALIDDVVQTPNRVVSTACNYRESSYGSFLAWSNGMLSAGSDYISSLVTAFRGCFPKGGIAMKGHTSQLAYPWENSTYSLDYSNNDIADNRVSFYEAVVLERTYAAWVCEKYGSCDGGCQSATNTVEHPQFAESTSGLSRKFFLVKASVPPVAPTISSVSAVASNRVTVYWNTVSGATRYDLYRSTTSTRPSSPYKTNVTSPYTDTAVTAGTRYYYWVAAVNSAGTSFSAYKSAVCIGPPATPVISVSSTTSDCLKISWDAVSGATSYNLYRSETTTRPAAVYKKGATSPYMDLEVVPGKKYYYWVAAVNDHGSSYSSYKSGTPSSAFTYTVVNGNTVAGGETIITGFANKNATGSLVIPSTLGGWPVRTIDEYVFANCTGLTSITLPSSLTEIGVGAFMRCSGLKTITIPANVASIGDAAFAGCSSLTSFVVDEDNLSYSASGGVLYNRGKSQVVAVAGGLTSVSLYGTATKILPWAFNECKKITTIEIPEGVTSIGERAFAGCTSLTSMTIPEGVTSIGERAFAGCKGLTSVTIPSSVTVVPSVEVSSGTWTAIDVSDIDCTYGYQSSRIGNNSSTSMSVKVVGPTTFSFKWKVSSEPGWDYLRWYLDGTQQNSISGERDWQTVTCSIPEGEHTIKWTYSKDSSSSSGSDCGWVAFNGRSAFDGCSNLTEVTLPCSTTTPLRQLFPHSYATIEHVTLTGKSETIAPDLFSGCAALKTIMIPSSVESIGDYTFYDCKKLDSVVFEGAPPTMGEHVFSEQLATIYYPVQYASEWNVAVNANSMLEDITLKELSELCFTITFNANGGTGGKAVTQNYDSALIAPTVMRMGYSFMGWVPAVPARVPLKNTTYVAQWENGAMLRHRVISGGKEVEILGLEKPYSGELTIPSKIDGLPVTSIAANAFKGYKGITSVTLPSTLTSIGESAFEGCTGLTSVTIPAKVKMIPYKAFYGCKGLTSVTISKGVQKIMGRAFENCTGLTSLTIPSGVTTLGGYTFSGCTGVKTLSVPSTITSVAETSFNKVKPSTLTAPKIMGGMNTSALTKVTVASGTTEVVYKAFYGCKTITSLTIPSGVKKIMGRAFENCTGLTTLTIPSGVTFLGGYTFSGCTGIKTLSIPSTITSVTETSFNKVKPSTLTAPKVMGGVNTSALTKVTVASGTTEVVYKAFYGCNTITSLTIPSGVKKIMGRAFENCTGLTTLTIPSGVTFLGGYTFSGCTGVKTLSVPSTITSVAETSFNKVKPSTLTAPKIMGGMNTSALTKVTVASGTKEVVYKAFYGCKTITSLTIPSGVKKIMGRAFENCTGLTTLTIPSGVTTLGGYTFSGCTGIKTLSIPSTITSVAETSFNKVKPSTLTAPKIMGGMTTSALTKVTIASGTTEVVYKAFYGCKTITSLTIPSGVKKIMGRAFENCTGLKTLTLPASITFIGGNTFAGCTGLTSVIFNGKPPTASTNSFPAKTGYYVPTYASNWKKVIDSKGKWNNLTMKAQTVSVNAMADSTPTSTTSVATVEPEVAFTIPAWSCGAFMGEVTQITADGTTATAMTLSIAADGSILGEMMLADGTEVSLKGCVEAMTETPAGMVLQVAADWTDAESVTFVITTDGLDYEAASANELATGLLMQVAP